MSKATVLTLAYLGLTGLIACQNLEEKNSVNTQSPPSNTLEELTADLGENYSSSTQEFVDEQGGTTLVMHRFERASTEDVPSEDRGMIRTAFFWKGEDEAFLVFDKAGWSYFYWTSWENDSYFVDIELELADFSTVGIGFELRGKTHHQSTILEGVDSIGDDQLNGSACRFNRKILSFAEKSLASRIGDGECWTLINEALKDSSAHSAINYRFGNFIGSGGVQNNSVLANSLPGDIIQFDAGVFLGADGYRSEAGWPNHTAMIRSISGNSITVYEQNAPVGGPAVVGEYHFDDMDSGTYRIYRAFPVPDSTQQPWCDTPLGVIHSYERMTTDMNGTILESHSTDEQSSDLTDYCQVRCDALEECDGYSINSQATECHLKSAEGAADSVETLWHQKVKSE